MSDEFEHVLTDDCPCNPEVLKVAPRGYELATVPLEEEAEAPALRPLGYTEFTEEEAAFDFRARRLRAVAGPDRAYIFITSAEGQQTEIDSRGFAPEKLADTLREVAGILDAELVS